MTSRGNSGLFMVRAATMVLCAINALIVLASPDSSVTAVLGWVVATVGWGIAAAET